MTDDRAATYESRSGTDRTGRSQRTAVGGRSLPAGHFSRRQHQESTKETVAEGGTNNPLPCRTTVKAGHPPRRTTTGPQDVAEPISSTSCIENPREQMHA